ncbi:MAG: hypothetical protein ACRDFB_11010 [Rhabdochlamydiaceae bacterium]
MGHIIQTLSGSQPIVPETNPPQNKVKSLSRSYFESLKPQDNVKNTLLISGIKTNKTKNDSSFDFIEEIIEINNNFLIKNKDQELASRFNKRINPGNIPDGHCASCAFNTHLHLMGQKIEEALSPDNYKKFGHWFYLKFSPRFEENMIESNENETYGTMKDRVEQKVKELTKSGEAVLISISDGAHWFNAYNDGKKVWFIDSQTGKGFNLYESKDRQAEEIISHIASINIIRVDAADIAERYSQIS